MNTFQCLKEFFLIWVEFFRHATRLEYCSLAIAGTIGFLWFKIMFRKPDGFDQHPTIDYRDPVDGRWAGEKAMLLLLMAFGSYWLAYYQLPDWFPTFFHGVPK
ncbi:hypothetical protein [Pedosphaera parvula]|uniref:Uncharacterized protein n=1 Tax=Pedosphaera parvula (strain Ellin514) TaxID=320771 RepID=B9XMD6_PEDPL|nr:hypothetical protein [Pedosphaera parvula]EEF58978.1 hypothetical protein Cflav_PD2027 [Pedosphaera parvula Ellin514]